MLADMNKTDKLLPLWRLPSRTMSVKGYGDKLATVTLNSDEAVRVLEQMGASQVNQELCLDEMGPGEADEFFNLRNWEHNYYWNTVSGDDNGVVANMVVASENGGKDLTGV